MVEPEHLASQARWADEFHAVRSRGLGGDDLAAVAELAASGRVHRLLIEADRVLAGHLDEHTGRIVADDLDPPQIDYLLDDLGALVENRGGPVHVLPTERPSATGLAATSRH